MDSDIDIGDLFTNQDYQLEKFSYKDIEVDIYCSKSATTDFDLTGQIIWPSAIELSKFIIDNNQLFEGKTVLELGAGAGLSGIIAAKYAKNVIISDGSEIVFKLIEQNVKIHQCEGKNLIARQMIWGNVECEELDKFLSSAIGDWCGMIDVIIGADIIFWQQSVQGLAEVLSYYHKQNDKVQIYVTGVKRFQQTEDNLDKLLNEYGGLKRIIQQQIQGYQQIVYQYQIK